MNTCKKIIAIVQGRMGSNRLPGKILLDIGGQPMLARVVNRTRRARFIEQVVVATTLDPSDDPVEEFCRQKGYPCYRGDLFDVLDRYYQAALIYQADVVVRITADCPVIDPAEIDRIVEAFLDKGVDFAANRLPPPFSRSIPIGMDVEVVSFSALEKAWKEATEKYEREHVMPYFYDKEGRFNILVLDHEPNLGHLRWTVDTPQDLEVLRSIYASFRNRDDFSLDELLAHSEEHPEWQEINANIYHNSFLDTDKRGNGKSKD
ncbi:MAG: glycosyltransferase family protein [Anaerolineaceae bacterium]|nr:glycosyltransferase family protein [Anaerolineaceae bacterium]